MVLIYRARHAVVVSNLVDAVAGTKSGRCVLWALDEVVADLASLTVGTGPGAKFEIIDRMLAVRPIGPEEYLLVADDDVRFDRGDLHRFLSLARLANFDVAQPAHTSRSHWNHHLLLVRPRVRARRTNFVEIGPLFLFSPRAVQSLLPFGDAVRMGWGLERVWANLAGQLGLHMGVVDEVTMVHLEPAGRTYDWQVAQADQEALWKVHGLLGDEDPPTASQVWRVAGRPPWVRKR